jgi:hypothetical protein
MSNKRKIIYLLKLKYINMFWRLCSFLLVFMMCLVTPAFAVEMEDVAHHAENYNEDSKKKQGILGKIKLIAKGFKLVNEAKEAEKESEKKKNETIEEKKETDEEVFKAHYQKINYKKELLKYRNRNTTSNDTNSTDNSTVTNSTNIPMTPITPQPCIYHIDKIIIFLTNQGYTVSYTQNNLIDNSLIGNIVQIIDNNGYIRYVQVTKVNSEGMTINTGSNEVFYSLDEFTKAYTGINLKTSENLNTVLNSINSKEKDDLNQENIKAHQIHDKARKKVIMWGVLIGVAVILIIVGAILCVTYGSQLIQAAANSKYTLEEALGIIDKDNLDDSDSVIMMKNSDESYMFDLKRDYAAMGIKMTVLTIPQMILYVASLNVVQVILCVVGLALVLMGIGLIIAGIIKTVRNGKKWHAANVIINRNKKDAKDLNKWISANSNITLPENMTKNNITNIPSI